MDRNTDFEFESDEIVDQSILCQIIGLEARLPNPTISIFDITMMNDDNVTLEQYMLIIAHIKHSQQLYRFVRQHSAQITKLLADNIDHWMDYLTQIFAHLSISEHEQLRDLVIDSFVGQTAGDEHDQMRRIAMSSRYMEQFLSFYQSNKKLLTGTAVERRMLFYSSFLSQRVLCSANRTFAETIKTHSIGTCTKRYKLAETID